MARPKKATVDYFPHQTEQGKTLFILQQRWGNDGFATWFKILERLGKTNNHVIDCNERASVLHLAAYCLVSENILFEILDFLAEVDAINRDFWRQKFLYSENFVLGVTDAYRRRLNELPTIEKVSNLINVTLTGLLTAETPTDGINVVRSTERERERERERKVITPPARMTLKNIRDSFREIIGVELGGGVNQSLSEIGMTYTPETINFALLATSTRTPKPTNPFMYFKSILEGKNNGHSESSGKSNNGKPSYDSCENRDYSAGEVFDRSDKW